MKLRDIVLDQIHHRESAQIPYTLAYEEEVGIRIDGHFGSDTWRDKLVPYIEVCGSIAVLPDETLDDTHYRDAFGSIWRTDELPPSVVEPGLKAPTLEGYAFPPVEVFLDPTNTAEIKALAVESCDSFTIVKTTLCLWQGWYLRGFQNTLMDCAAEEGFFGELLDRLTDLCLGLVNECADIPVAAIMMADDWGDQRGVLIGPERWRRLYKPRYARIFEAIHAQGKLAIMHCCGSVADIMGDIVEIGLDVLESVQPEAAGMNPYALKRAWGEKITFWGGLGSQHTIPFATPVEIRKEIRHLRSEMGRGGGYILAPAKPLRPETPTENAVAVVEEFLAA
jgi:uroporphyrinogen decarboxylase